MEASPRDNEETTLDDRRRPRRRDRTAPLGELTGLDDLPEGMADGVGRAVRAARGADGTDAADAADDGADDAAATAPEEPQDLRPPRKLRLWQVAPIVVLGALGSLMFAFPLAFEPGRGSGAVVSMLGLLICGCAAGWGVMAARRVGLAWPGLPARGSEQRPDWRVALLYVVVVGTLVVLAIWRVARLR